MICLSFKHRIVNSISQSSLLSTTMSRRNNNPNQPRDFKSRKGKEKEEDEEMMDVRQATSQSRDQRELRVTSVARREERSLPRENLFSRLDKAMPSRLPWTTHEKSGLFLHSEGCNICDRFGDHFKEEYQASEAFDREYNRWKNYWMNKIEDTSVYRETLNKEFN